MTVRKPSFSATGAPLGGLSYGANPARASDAYGADFNRQMQQYMQANAAQNTAAMTKAAAGQDADAARAEANWQKVLANTEGRGNAVMADPYTQAALSRLNGVTSGRDLPYTDQVQTQLLARQADAGASAMDAQRQMIESQQTALGGSMADPSAQAALRRLLAQNQAQNAANLGDMQTKATLTNFGAQNDAARGLAGIRAGQLGQANQAYGQAAHYYANQQLNGQHQNAVGNGGWGSYGTTTSILGGGGSQAPAFRPTDYLNVQRPQAPAAPKQPYAPKPWSPMPQPTPYGVPKPYGAYDPSKPIY